MAKSQETFSKKEKEKLKLKRRKEKEEKKAERKANAVKGGGLEDMMAYVDENGNLTNTPPDPKKKRVNNVEDMVIGVQRQVAEAVEIQRKGIVSFFNESKGYGFIKDLKNQESVFVHINGLVEKIKEGDKVNFEIEMTHKGASAVKVKMDRGEKVVPPAPVVAAPPVIVAEPVVAAAPAVETETTEEKES